MKNAQDLDKTIFDLRKRGYRLDFIFYSKCLICLPLRLKIDLSDIEIDESYKFLSKENPTKQNVLCALKTSTGQRGIILEQSDRIFELFEFVRPKKRVFKASEKKSKKLVPSLAQFMFVND